MNIDFNITACPFELDKKLQKYFNYTNGIFFEAGANNGITQSNTYILEKFFNWTGILVEPSPHWFNKLKINRPDSQHFNCALVSNDWNRETIAGDFGNIENLANNLMSTTEQSVIFNRYNHNFDIEIDAKTMNNVISFTKFVNFDLISLDCEGSEFSILTGFDFNKYRTNFFLIEIFADNQENYYNIFNLLKENGYELEEKLSDGDYLFKNKNKL